MFLHALESLRGSEEAAAVLYFAKGQQIAWTLAEIARWRFGAEAAAGSVLDFAAGFGRATRFLAARFPRERIWASEIDPTAVRFQTEVLGVQGLRAPARAADFDPGRRFDLILAASFFSHLPAPAFEEWLARLHGCLEPGGVLAFSVHGPALHADPAADWSEGLIFLDRSESRRLDTDRYGTSFATEAFVRRTAENVCGRDVPVFAYPFGLCAHQDLYLVPKAPVPAEAPVLTRLPRGELLGFDLGPDVLLFRGWTETAGGDPPPEVSLWVGHGRAARVTATGTGHRLPWELAVSKSEAPPDALVRIEAGTIEGLANILAMGTLRPHLEASASAPVRAGRAAREIPNPR